MVLEILHNSLRKSKIVSAKVEQLHFENKLVKLVEHLNFEVHEASFKLLESLELMYNE